MSLCGNNNPCPDLIAGQKCGITYTGARYVPLFADPAEWSNANAYEPLTIVIHEGNSYTSKTFVPVGVDISNEKYWALTGNYNAQVEAYRNEVLEYINKTNDLIDKTQYVSNTFNTVADMLSANLKQNMVCNTLGYTASGDGGHNYYVISSVGTPAIGTVLELNNGLYAKAVFINEDVRPQQFGISSGEQISTSAPKFEAYINYVNNTDGKYFYFPAGKYYMNKGFYTKKSVIGEECSNSDITPYLYVDNTNGILPIGTGTSSHGIPLDKSAVIGVSEMVMTTPIEIKNFTLMCGTSLEALVDYGIYLPDVSKVKLTNLRIGNPEKTGVIGVRSWLLDFNNVNVYGPKLHGFNIGFQEVIETAGIATTVNLSNCYVQGGSGSQTGHAYVFLNTHYTTIQNCACDGWKNQTGSAYRVIDCDGFSIMNCGTEGCTVNEIVYIDQCNAVTVQGVYALSPTITQGLYRIRGLNGSIVLNEMFVGNLSWNTAGSAQKSYLRCESGSSGLIDCKLADYPTITGGDKTTYYINSNTITVNIETAESWIVFKNGTLNNVSLTPA